MFLELTIKVVAFFLGHPCIAKDLFEFIDIQVDAIRMMSNDFSVRECFLPKGIDQTVKKIDV